MLACEHRDKAKRVRFKRSSQGAAIAYIGARRQETTPVGSELTYRFVFETYSKFVDILAKLFQPKSNVGVLLVYGSPVEAWLQMLVWLEAAEAIWIVKIFAEHVAE